jgi:hypothetical protein
VTRVKAITFLLAGGVLAACAIDATDDGDPSAIDESDVTARELSGKQLRSISRAAPYRAISFVTANGALTYRAERNATGELETGKATLAAGKLTLVRDDVSESFVLSGTGEKLVLLPEGDTAGFEVVKEKTPAPGPPAPPLLPSWQRNVVRLENGRVFAMSKIVNPEDPRTDTILGSELDAATGTWVEMPGLPAFRFEGTMSYLGTSDGRIIAVGEPWLRNPGGVVIHDTKSGDWSLAPGPHRDYFGVGVCPDGTILALGGELPDERARVRWPTQPEAIGKAPPYIPAPTGPREIPALSPTVTSSKDGILYVVGGTAVSDSRSDGVRRGISGLTTAWAYDCKANAVRVLPPMTSQRVGAAAVVGVDGRLFVFGGRVHFNGVPSGPPEVYDPRTDAWSELPPLPLARGNAILGPDGLVWYGSGAGSVLDAFDPATGRWTSGLSRVKRD